MTLQTHQAISEDRLPSRVLRVEVHPELLLLCLAEALQRFFSGGMEEKITEYRDFLSKQLLEGYFI